MSVHCCSPVWSKLLSPVYEGEAEWGYPGFQGGREKGRWGQPHPDACNRWRFSHASFFLNEGGPGIRAPSARRAWRGGCFRSMTCTSPHGSLISGQTFVQGITPDYLTLDEALAQKCAKITEVSEGGSVP